MSAPDPVRGVAILTHQCCEADDLGRVVRAAGVRWRLSTCLYGETEYDTQILTGSAPTVEAREAWLRDLGLQRCPEESWNWQENLTPENSYIHCHGPQVEVYAIVRVQDLVSEPAAAAAGEGAPA